MPGRPIRRFIGYPAGSLLAVLPDPESAAAAAAAVHAAGIPDRDITILRGPEGADRLDGTGAVATEEVELWRGPEPNVPGLLRR